MKTHFVESSQFLHSRTCLRDQNWGCTWVRIHPQFATLCCWLFRWLAITQRVDL